MTDVRAALEALANDGPSVGLDLTGELFVLGGIALTALLGWCGTIIAKRVREPTRIETLWARLDAQDQRITAIEAEAESAKRRDIVKGYIIRALVRQWPGAAEPPTLDPGYLAELDEATLPLDHPWRENP